MKKSLIAALAVVLLASAYAMAGHFTETLPSQAAYGATAVSNGYDYQLSTDSGAPSLAVAAPFSLYSRTLAQMNALAPVQAGQVIFVSDGLQAKICVSTGTAAGAWVVASATSTAVVGGLLGHCQ